MHSSILYYFIIFSISSLEGIEFAVPILVVESPAVAEAKEIASFIGIFSINATAKPALNASPAPVVSTTGFSRFAIGIGKLSCSFAKNAPFSPRVIIIFLISLFNNLSDAFLASSRV